MSDESKQGNDRRFTQADTVEVVRKLREYGDEVRVDYYRNGSMKRIRVYVVKNNDE